MTLFTPALNLQPFALYNEIDDYAASWLERLIQAGHIAKGIADRRSIEDLRGDDLRGFRQVHFFAGIGVWSYALRRAGVPDDVAVWTGSCPCQPFSAAGKGGGMDDERHLWPALLHLIRERRPVRFLGEQVASKDGLGWLDLVSTDLEAEGYAVGALDTCSAGSGAPHIRQRLRIYAYDLRLAAGEGSRGVEHPARDGRLEWRPEPDGRSLVGGRGFGRLDHHHHQGLEGLGSGYPSEGGRDGSVRPVAATGEFGGLADCDRDQQRNGGDGRGAENEGLWADTDRRDDVNGLADAGNGQLPQPIGRAEGRDGYGSDRADPDRSAGRPGPTNGFWRDADWLFCRDGKWRPIEPGTFPLAHGAPARVGRLRAYGNAVDAEATTDFIEACCASADDLAARSVTEIEGLLV